jgi:hypothetical protein
VKEEDFPFVISNFSFVIASNSSHRLESGLVRLARRGTSALSKQRAEKLWSDEK